MKLIKTYKEYKESLVIDFSTQIQDLLESMNIWHDAVLSSIKAEEKDIFDELKLPKDFYENRLSLEFLSDNIEFINSLSSLGLKKSQVQDTTDFQTFISKPFKFMFIYNIESNELENPIYIICQVWNETMKKWENVKFYKIHEDIKKFYDKLSSKTIEISDGDKNYIYVSSNGANEWTLQNKEKEDDTFKSVLRQEELEKIVDDRKIKINII